MKKYSKNKQLIPVMLSMALLFSQTGFTVLAEESQNFLGEDITETVVDEVPAEMETDGASTTTADPTETLTTEPTNETWESTETTTTTPEPEVMFTSEPTAANESTELLTTEPTNETWESTETTTTTLELEAMFTSEPEGTPIEKSSEISPANVSAMPLMVTTGVTAVADDKQGVFLSWNAVPEAEGYIIYRRVGSDGSFSYLSMTTQNTFFTDSSASFTDYNFYRVYPYKNVDGNRVLGDSGQYAYAKASVGTSSNLQAQATAGIGVELTWDEMPGADGYIIYRKLASESAFSYLSMTTKGTVYTDKTASFTEFNFYRVYPYKMVNGQRVLGKSGQYVYCKNVVGISANLKAEYISDTSAALSWDVVNGAEGYIIYRKAGNEDKFSYLSMTTRGTTYTDKAMVKGQYNFYRVYPFITVDGKRVLGQSGTYVYPVLESVSSLSAKANSTRGIVVSWSDVKGADGYIIYRKKATEEKFSYLYMTTGALNYTDKNLQTDIFYFYRVYPFKTIDGVRKLGPSTAYVYAKPVSSEKLSGLTLIDGDYYYYLSNGTLRKGFSNYSDIGKAYFDEVTGKMLLGLQTVKSNGYTYYFLEGGGVLTGLQTVDGKTYYFNPSSGVMQTGYIKINDKPYYFDQTTGEMQTGIITVNLTSGVFTYYFEETGGVYKGLKVVDGKTYYFDNNSGIMRTGYVKINDKPYYFDKTSGEMKTGMIEVELSNGKYTYYFEENGGVYSGLKTIDGKTYYFNPGSGIMRTGYVEINNVPYYFDTVTGEMRTGMIDVQLSDGKYTFYFEEDGGVFRGFKTIDDKLYYFNTGKGELVRGAMMVIDNKKYYFDDNTGEAVTGPVKVKSTGLSYVFDPASEQGVLLGMAKFNDATYFLDEETGVMRFGYWSVGRDAYYFDRDNGQMLVNASIEDTYIGLNIQADAQGRLSFSILNDSGRATALYYALQKVGVSYGTGEDQLVCSSLVSYAYSMAGMNDLNNLESFEQMLKCKENGWFIEPSKGDNLDDILEPGDLVFWQKPGCEDVECDHVDEVHHVGLYLGKNQMVEASEQEGIMLIRDIQMDDATYPIYGYAKVPLN